MAVQKRSHVDWDGLRYFRAVAAAGSLSEAARQLRVEGPTIARRLDRLELDLGVRLFLRNPRGYVLTDAGTALVESVEAIHSRIDEVAQLPGGEDTGTVHIATADLLATEIVLPALRPLLQAMPKLEAVVVSDTRMHDLSQHDADIALRLGATIDSHLIAKRIARVGFGIYAARKDVRKGIDIATARYVAFDDSVGSQPHDEWLAGHARHARIVVRANRQHTLLNAVRLGVGLGILPCMAADGDSSLARILGPSDVFYRDLYIVMHRDVRRARRVRAVVDAIEQYVALEHAQIAG